MKQQTKRKLQNQETLVDKRERTLEIVNPDAQSDDIAVDSEPTAEAEIKPQRIGRLENLDVARGFAIVGMFLSHTVKALLGYQQIPEWGLVPMHALTKFSSSLFIMIFGISLSLFFVPDTQTSKWPKKRKRLLFRSLEIMFWYKALTLVQMFQTYPRELVVDALSFGRFPDFVEVLGFYAFCLMWIPFFLPQWAKLGIKMKIFLIIAFAVVGNFLNVHFDFWGYDSLKAILVEKNRYFTFGQLQRGSLVLLGLLLGDFLRTQKRLNWGQVYLGLITLGLALVCGSYFYFMSGDNFYSFVMAIAKNHGKHPPTLLFMSYSLAIALSVFSICMWGQKYIAIALKPLAWIGQHSLTAFNFHIFIIFVLYRYIFDFRAKVTYEQALWLFAALTVSMAGLAFYKNWKKSRV